MIAEHILESEIDRDGNRFIGQLKKVLKAAGEDTVFAIRMHPENQAIFEKIGSKLSGDVTDLENVRIIKDSSLDKMGCVLITSTGLIDASLSTQIEQVRLKTAHSTEQSTLEEAEFLDTLQKEHEPTDD
jgi:flagellar biosynthesis/type III secretory pathway protein FliH